MIDLQFLLDIWMIIFDIQILQMWNSVFLEI